MNRDELGKMVRDIWVAHFEATTPGMKGTFSPWENVSEQNKALYCSIGEALYNLGRSQPASDIVDPHFYFDVGFNK